MKEKYYLNEKRLPTIPVPHDCIIKNIELNNDEIVFVFDDDISYNDSVKYYNSKAKSLVIKYHFAYEPNDFSIYKWEDNCYKPYDKKNIRELVKGNFNLEYLYHNVGYCSIIIRLSSDNSIIIEADIDYVEFEWIY